MTVGPADDFEHPPEELWDVNFALDPPTPVHTLSAAGGFVVAAGASLHTLRPGAQRLRSRDTPPDFEVRVVAAEPWSPYRFAMASPTSVKVFTGHRPYEPLMTFTSSGPEFRVTHLAWCRHDGGTMLYLRHAGGSVSRLRMGESGTETLQCPPALAIAADERGLLAVLAAPHGDDAMLWAIHEGAKHWDKRFVSDDLSDDDAMGWEVFLSVHRPAIAYSMSGDAESCGFCSVSWEQKDEDEDDGTESPPGVFQGPTAFQNERVLFAAYNVDGQVRILRHVRGAGITRIARFGVGEDWTGIPATVTALAWDEERRTLWAASPELGLIRLTEPAASKSASHKPS